MKRTIGNSVRQEATEMFTSGISAKEIVARCGISSATLYRWVGKYCTRCEQPTFAKFTAKHHVDALNRIRKLEQMVEVLQSVHCSVHASIRVKLEEMDLLKDKYNSHVLCAAMKVSRGTWLNHVKRSKGDKAWHVQHRRKIEEAVKDAFDEYRQILGSAKLTVVLQSKGYHVSKDMVAKAMRKFGLVSIRCRKRPCFNKEDYRIRNRLARRFNPPRPNAIWAGDIKEFHLKQHKYFICSIIDLFSRRVIATKVGTGPTAQLVSATFRIAWQSRGPIAGLMFHADRGGCYRSLSFHKKLKALGVELSFSNAYRPYDNSVLESYFKNLTVEELERHYYRAEREFRHQLASYEKFYNEKRPHSGIGNRIPAEKEADYERDRNENGGFDSQGFGGFFVDFYDLNDAFSLAEAESP